LEFDGTEKRNWDVRHKRRRRLEKRIWSKSVFDFSVAPLELCLILTEFQQPLDFSVAPAVLTAAEGRLAPLIESIYYSL
jgi:hypothetical protein